MAGSRRTGKSAVRLIGMSPSRLTVIMSAGPPIDACHSLQHDGQQHDPLALLSRVQFSLKQHRRLIYAYNSHSVDSME